jgi:hypothetical protein
MKRNDIKVGTFVWWSRIGNSTSQNISSAGIISNVSKIGFRVITFDEMKEMEEEIPFSSETVRAEFSVTTPKKALAFHKKKMDNLRNQMVETRREAQKALEALREHSQKSERIWRSSSLYKFLREFETA